MNYALIHGNFTEGYELIGPFVSFDAADDYSREADHTELRFETWIAPIRTPGASIPEELWDNDFVQFARLLDEIIATQDALDIRALAKSMDLDPTSVDDLFDRARALWGQAKADV